MNVYQAINAVQLALSKEGITKQRTNTHQNYKFRGIDDVYNAICPLLAQHGLCILPRMLSRTCEERTTKKGDAMFYVTVEAEFDFVASQDGSKHTVRTYGEAMDTNDKATNKAMSAAYKYAAFQAFAIPTEGDNDADAHSHEATKPAYPELAKMAVAATKDSLKALFDTAYARAKAANDADGGRKLLEAAKQRNSELVPPLPAVMGPDEYEPEMEPT